jgi:hypothetical protein
MNAVADAWSDIQLARTDWEFMRQPFSHAVTPGVFSYSAVDLGIAAGTHDRFVGDTEDYQPTIIFDPAIGVSDQQSLSQITIEQWSMIYGRGAQTNSRPCYYAIAGGKMYLGPIPDKAYTLAGSYWQAPQALVNDADVPIMPAHFHNVIKWGALMTVHGLDSAFADRATAQAKYSSLYRQLVNHQTRPVLMGGSLA